MISEIVKDSLKKTFSENGIDLDTAEKLIEYLNGISTGSIKQLDNAKMKELIDLMEIE
jgi:hypothetical protein